MKTSVDLVDILQEHKSHHGLSLQEHLVGLIDSIIKEKKEKELFDKFEVLSSFAKQNRLNYSAPKLDKEVNKVKKATTEMTEWENEILELLGVNTFDYEIINNFPLLLLSENNVHRQ